MNKKFFKKYFYWLLLFVIVDSGAIEKVAFGYNDNFSQYEIRVIRPKYFSKRSRFELGTQGIMIMNHAYVYTFMASGILGYHFSEYLGLQLNADLGFSLDRNEKKVLFQEFNVKTTIFRTLYSIGGEVVYTPAYGKVQLPASGRLLYFDTYVALGGGMTGVDWRYSDFCFDQSNKNPNLELKSNTIGAYPTIIAGIGQRIFYTKSNAFKWDIKMKRVMYANADKECYVGSEASGTGSFDNVTLQFGISKFL